MMLMLAGVRQNNAAITRSCPHGAGKSGMAFFQEDEDEWGLAAVLQVGFLEALNTQFLKHLGCPCLIPVWCEHVGPLTMFETFGLPMSAPCSVTACGTTDKPRRVHHSPLQYVAPLSLLSGLSLLLSALFCT
jgi:hypothetical protein